MNNFDQVKKLLKELKINDYEQTSAFKMLVWIDCEQISIDVDSVGVYGEGVIKYGICINKIDRYYVCDSIHELKNILIVLKKIL